MVVPDDVTHTSVPNVAGLLTYQIDTEVLRFRKADAWKAVAEKELVSAYTQCLPQDRHIIIYGSSNSLAAA